jgi:hypothetical protein
MAMGRSKPEPSFLRSAGARLMVMRVGGRSKPEFLMADRTRSRDSRTAASGRPTVAKVSSWVLIPEKSTSTSMMCASMP